MALTHTPDDWQTFTVTDSDLERVEDVFLDQGIPFTVQELADYVVQGRAETLAAAHRRVADDQSRLYQPKLSYEVGQRVRFPALDLVGVVEAIRPGENPDLGQFSVLRIHMERGGVREFAADYATDHPLNRDEPAKPTADALASVGMVSEALAESLEQMPDYIAFGDYWFRKDLMPNVVIGHLHIAEAMIDMQGEAQSTNTLVNDVEVPAAEPAARVFALNYALAHDPDGRFVNVGTADAPRWALRQGVTA